MADRNGKPWTRDDDLLVLNLYWRLPFARFSQRNGDVISLAALLQRTPGSIALRLSNFASLDPVLQARGVGGMPHAANLTRRVWEEYQSDPESVVLESERLLAEQRGSDLADDVDDPAVFLLEGREREAVVKVRLTQRHFRRLVLNRYDATCCITGLQIPEVLVAAHIVRWADDPTIRMDPRNGLCLNALHDRAFDSGLITIDEEMRIRVSERLTDGSGVPADLITRYDGQPLTLPVGFSPDPALLRRHRERFAAA